LEPTIGFSRAVREADPVFVSATAGLLVPSLMELLGPLNW
jgi:hypothetical protein